jgi:hypothetical protein
LHGFVSRSWNGTDLAQAESFALSTLLPVLLEPASLVLKSKAKQSGHPRGMGWNPLIQLPDENRSAFVKIDKTGSDCFYRFRSD